MGGVRAARLVLSVADKEVFLGIAGYQIRA